MGGGRTRGTQLSFLALLLTTANYTTQQKTLFLTFWVRRQATSPPPRHSSHALGGRQESHRGLSPDKIQGKQQRSESRATLQRRTHGKPQKTEGREGGNRAGGGVGRRDVSARRPGQRPRRGHRTSLAAGTTAERARTRVPSRGPPLAAGPAGPAGRPRSAGVAGSGLQPRPLRPARPPGRRPGLADR